MGKVLSGFSQDCEVGWPAVLRRRRRVVYAPKPDSPRVDSASLVTSLYSALLDREPVGGEELNKVAYLERGGTVEEVVAMILASLECQLHFFRNPIFDDIVAPEPLPLDVPRLYFWHIPKTGGSSLREMLRGHFNELEFSGGLTLTELYRMSSYRLRSIRVFAGHFGPTLPQLLAEVPLTTVTLLRDPVDVVVSNYRHWRYRGLEGNPYTALARELSFEDWCRSEDTQWLRSDSQAQALCLPRFPPGREEALASPDGGMLHVPGMDLREAAVSALEGVDIVGTLDDLSDVYRACLDSLNVSAPATQEVLTENVGLGAEEEVSETTREWLLETNTVDSVLFEQAKQRGELLRGRSGGI